MSIRIGLWISGIISFGPTRLRLQEEDILGLRLLEDPARSRIRRVLSKNTNGRRVRCFRGVSIGILRA